MKKVNKDKSLNEIKLNYFIKALDPIKDRNTLKLFPVIKTLKTISHE